MKFFRRKELADVWGDNLSMIQQYRVIWNSNPTLRKFYTNLWEWAIKECTSGPIVELGGGAGFIRDYYPDIISTDLLPFPESNLQCNATQLPFKENSVGCFIGIAFFHHCPNLRILFNEILAALKPGGCFVIIDPYISILSRWIFALATDETVDLGESPLENDYDDDNQINPLLDANVARATIVFIRQKKLYDALFPNLQVQSIEHINLFRHIAAGSCVQQFPCASFLYPPACIVDRLLQPVSLYTGMCMKVVLKKTA